MNAEEKIAAYANELGIGSMTVESLIDSHRYLRGENVKRIEEQRAEMQRCRDIATQQARQWVTEHEYVSVERLRTMTLAQIAELICDQ